MGGKEEKSGRGRKGEEKRRRKRGEERRREKGGEEKVEGNVNQCHQLNMRQKHERERGLT